MRNVKGIIALSLLLAIPLFYQNCGDVTLERPEVFEAPEPLETSTLQARMCPSSETSLSLSSKVIFIVDMSMSNLGEGVSTSCAGSTCFHTIVGFGDEEVATDFTGERFEMVNSVISALNAEASANVFSVIGFHDSPLTLEGVESCNSGFIPTSSAISSINALMAMQAADRGSGGSIANQNPNNPFRLRATAYGEALNCLAAKLHNDIINNYLTKSFYNIVFLTDGKASDVGDYAGMIQTIFNAYRHDMLGMRLYPVYYGKEGDEQSAALALLNPMAHVLDPGVNTYVSNNFDDLRETLVGQLSTSVQLNYNLKGVGVVNLTSLNKKGSLFTDSNMNGTPDGEEGDEGISIRDIVESFAENINEDKDSIPSFLEAIRGLNPQAKDDFLDMDLDGKNNFEELVSGRDLFSHESDYPTPDNYLLKFNSYLDLNQMCPSGQPVNRLDINQIPLVKNTLGYIDPNPGTLDFSYNADENLVMIYYIAEPLNSGDLKPRIYVNLIRIAPDDATNIVVDAADFRLLGEF